MLLSLLILVPTFVLFLAAVVILVLKWLRPGSGIAWLIAAVGAFLSWGILLVLHSRLPLTFSTIRWRPEGVFGSSPAFSLDEISWPFAVALATLVVAVILTATARYQYQTNAVAWAGSLAITAVGLLAVQAANPLTLLMSWTAIDLVELLILINSVADRQLNERAVVVFAARVIGTFIVYYSAVGNQTTWHSFQFFNIPSQAGLYFLVGTGLRLGVLPLHLPFQQEPPLRRGLGNVLRLVPAASSLVILARLPAGVVEAGFAPLLLGLTAFAAFYSGMLWFTSSDELAGRPYWVIALAAMAVACVVRGDPGGALVWGITLILSGCCLFLYSARSLRLIFIPVLGIWGLSGLPFSPSAGGWAGLTSSPVGGLNVIFLAAHILLLMGYARHTMRQGDSLQGMEQWVNLTYPLGLILLAVTHVLLGLGGWSGSRTIGIWWASGLSLILAVVIGVVLRRLALPGGERSTGRVSSWLQPVTQTVYRGVVVVLRLDWLYRLLWGFYRLIGRLVNNLTSILEGDGGVLWALVLLALLLSVFSVEGIR